MIQINRRLCKNWHCKSKNLTQKIQSVTLTLISCTGMGLVLHKSLDKALLSWIKSIEGFEKNPWNCEIFITKLLYKILSLWPWHKGHVLGWEWYHIKFWTSFYHHAKHELIHQRLHQNRHCKNQNRKLQYKNSKSVTLTLKSSMGLRIVLSKILAQHLSSYQTWNKYTTGFGNNEVLKT